MSLSKYPSYKDSGVEWLSDIPEGWVSHSVRHCLQQIFNGLSANQVDESTETVPVTRIETISTGLINIEKLGHIHQSEARPDRLLLGGDILFSNINSLNMIGNCAQYSGDFKIYAGMNLLVLRPKLDVDHRWIFWVIKCSAFRKEVESFAKPAINQASISQQSILNIRVSVGSHSEQTLIAKFLDRETAKIDDLIAEQEKLIKLLDEKRQAMISHAVTKGLNPDAPMKDSGVMWLGVVPEHWEVKPLKYMAKIGNGSTPHRDNLEYWENGHYPWLNSSVVNQDEIIESDQFVTALALKECHLPIIKPPAILVGITGQGRTRGMAATLVFEATINQHVVYVKPIEAIVNISFLRRFFDKSYSDLRTDSDWAGSTKGAITCEQIENLEIPLPSLLEQATIVTYLDKKTIQLDTLKTEALLGIDLLKERRSALISAAVTGKIDVRGLVNTEAA